MSSKRDIVSETLRLCLALPGLLAFCCHCLSSTLPSISFECFKAEHGNVPWKASPETQTCRSDWRSIWLYWAMTLNSSIVKCTWTENPSSRWEEWIDLCPWLQLVRSVTARCGSSNCPIGTVGYLGRSLTTRVGFWNPWTRMPASSCLLFLPFSSILLFF